MSLLRFALSTLSMESWPWSRDLFEMFGLLLAMPLCLISIPFPLPGGILLCADAVLSVAIAYSIGQPGEPPFGGWILFCNVPEFLLGLFVIRLRCAELGIGFWDAFSRRQPTQPTQENFPDSGVLSTLLSWLFAPRTKVRLSIVWTLLSVASILVVRFTDSGRILVLALSFPSSILLIILSEMNKIGHTGALLGCLVAGFAQWFVLVPTLAGFVRRRSERQANGDQTRRPMSAKTAVVVALAGVVLALAIVKGIERWGAEIREPMEEVEAAPPMVIAASRDQINIVEDLIRQGKDVNSSGHWGNTPLMSAAARGNMKMTRMLIENGADVNARDKLGQTSLMHAAFSAGSRNGQQADILTLLLERGADVQAKDKTGTTVLQRLNRSKQTDPKLIAILEAAEASQRRP